MNRTALLLASAASAVAFAANKDAAAAAPKTSAPAAPAGDKPVVVPNLTAISATPMPLPQRGARGGKGSIYPFDGLLPPQRDEQGNVVAAYSFGVTNKTARDLSSIVSNANKKYMKKKTNADGSFVYKMNEVETSPGVKVQVPSSEHVMEAERKFAVYAVDPKTDPEGAQARVYREL